MSTEPGRDESVFVNCPFDDAYRPALEAVVLTCVTAGFYPLLGSGGSPSMPRIERILRGMVLCRYSIHDLSRCRGEGSENLARFNMPLELGMAMALRGIAPHAQDAHEYMILVPDSANRYQRFVSDLSGLDPFCHDGSSRVITVRVLSWLLTLPAALAHLAPGDVLARLGEFSTAWATLDGEWDGTAPWGRVVAAAAEVAAG